MRKPKTKNSTILFLFNLHKDKDDIVDIIYWKLKNTKFETSSAYIRQKILEFKTTL